MTINRIRAPGAWTAGSVLTPAEVEAIDANLVRAIDGNGGTYAPTSTISLGDSLTAQPLTVWGTLAAENIAVATCDISETLDAGAVLASTITAGTATVSQLTVSSQLNYTWPATTYPVLSSRTIRRPICLDAAITAPTTEWSRRFNSYPVRLLTQATVGGASAATVFELGFVPPDGASLIAVHVTVCHLGRTDGSAPTVRPVFLLGFCEPDEITSATRSALVYDSESAAQYGSNSQRTLVVPVTSPSATNHSTTPGIYYLSVQGETGSSLVAGYTVIGAVAEYTTTTLRP
jgi:hypothetical protein